MIDETDPKKIFQELWDLKVFKDFTYGEAFNHFFKLNNPEIDVMTYAQVRAKFFPEPAAA